MVAVRRRARRELTHGRCRRAPRAARAPASRRRLVPASSRWRSLTRRIAAWRRVEAVGPCRHLVVVARALAVRAQQRARCVGELRVVGDDGAAVAPGAEVLGRVEAEAAGVAERAGAAALVAGAVGLAGVLDDADRRRAAERRAAAPCRPCGRRGGPGSRSGSRSVRAALDDLGGEQAGRRVDVDEDRRGADGADRLGGGDEACWSGTITSSPGPMPSARRASSRAAVPEETPTACVGLALGRRTRLSKSSTCGAEGEGARRGDARDLCQQLLEQLRVVAVEADEGDRQLRRQRPSNAWRSRRDCQHRGGRGGVARWSSSAWSARRPRWCRPWIGALGAAHGPRSRRASGRRRDAARRRCAARRAARRAPRAGSASGRPRNRRRA